MYISRIQLKNIRSFKNLEINLLQKEKIPNLLTLIIGKNGTCKTTLLRSIVIGLCSEADAYTLLSEPIGTMITEGKQKAEIKIDLIPTKYPASPITISTKIEQNLGKEIITKENGQQNIANNLLESLFLCSYGAGRSTTGSEIGRSYRIADSVYTLFNYNQTLIDPELTLRRLQDYLDKDTYIKVIQDIKKVLDLSPEDEIRLPKGGGIELSGTSLGKQIPVQAWADGCRIVFYWLLDLYGWAMRADKVTSSGGIKGIVLIDELEQHLHPSLQTEMPGRLNKIFPEIQFVATTQSPLMVLGASPSNVVSLRREDNMVFSEDIPDFSGYSAEDMLVDHRLFNTEAYAPETNEKLNVYHQLSRIPKDKRTQKQTEDLRSLAEYLRTQQIPEVRESIAAKKLKKLFEKRIHQT
ncbi:MAG: AAA family ATPase [Desulfobacterales bacterium]|nr:AAA family ATPase [Desulfobacterales bacterium]